MKLPDDIRDMLSRRFHSKHREWLRASLSGEAAAEAWPFEISLGVPSEQAALRQIEGVRAWISAWRQWQGAGELVWSERRWRALGAQRLPDKLIIAEPSQAAAWAGEADRWSRACARHAAMSEQWPALADALPRQFTMLADYADADFTRLFKMLSWISAHPNSNLYPRQLPISGLDSKWLESRKRLVMELLSAMQGQAIADRDFYVCCGLRPQPRLVRLRILDHKLSRQLGGLSDISAPWEQIASLDIPLTHAFIVENLQTGLAFEELPGAVVLMRLGYGVDALGRLPWLRRARCLYWGDIDTHGFAILNRARTYLPELESVLMDEETLLSHRELWVEEHEPHAAADLPLLTAAEQKVCQALKLHKWGQNLRLEQERIQWDTAWNVIQRCLSPYIKNHATIGTDA